MNAQSLFFRAKTELMVRALESDDLHPNVLLVEGPRQAGKTTAVLKEGIGASLRTEVGFGKPLYAPLSVRADFGFFNDVFIDGRVRRITRYTDVYLGLSSGIFAGAAIECNSQFEKGTVCTVQPALSLDLLRFFSR